MGRTVTWIGIAAGVATIVSCVVGVVTYFESPTRTQPPPHSAHPSTAPVEQPEIGGVDDRSTREAIRGRKADSQETPTSAVAIPAQWSEGVGLGYSVDELREATEVREMMQLEQGQELSSLRGVYGFVHYLSLSGSFGPNAEIDFSVNREQDRKGVEVHKTTEGDVMLLMYVDESTAARLGSAHGEVGSIFGFFRPGDGHAVLAGLPVRRILDWEHRAGGKDGFAEIQID